VAFDYPNLNRLAHYLADALGSAALAGAGDTHPMPAEQETIEHQIHDRLEELEGLLKAT
jgi:hypothetical protein